MLKKRNLLFLSLLILGVFLITGCWLIPTPTYTVTYNGNGNTNGTVPIDTNLYEEGAPVTVLGNTDNLEKPGFDFAGWNTAVDGSGTIYIGGTFDMGTANVTLYAQWTINTYTVTFNSQEGSTVASQTVEHGGLVTKPTDPTREGYAFGGWYKESGCENAWVFNTDTVTSDVTLYAKWTINTYTVTFNKNGGDTEANPQTKTATHGGNVGTLPTEPTRTGYNFDSWNSAENGSGTEFTATTAVTADITVYAQWVAVITISEIPGVTAPVTGEAPVTEIDPTAQYTGTVAWDPVDDPFLGETVYTATITLTAKAGFTLTGVTENFFTVAGVTTPTNDIDSGVVTAAFPETLVIGAAYQGGKIAYILQSDDPGYDASVQHGLIAATEDQSTVDGIIWALAAHQSTEVTGTPLKIGSGSANTDLIIAQNDPEDEGIDTYAAGLARACTDGEHNDWFLPSKDELDKLYTNKVAIGGFAGDSYWSSSEGGALSAWSQFFLPGHQASIAKYFTFRVRAVRAF